MQTSLRSSYQSYYEYAGCGGPAVQQEPAPGAGSGAQFHASVARAFILADRLDNNNTAESTKYSNNIQIERLQEQPAGYELAEEPAITCYASQLYQADHLHQHQHHLQPHQNHQQAYAPVADNQQQQLDERIEAGEYQPEYGLQDANQQHHHHYQTLYYEPVHFQPNSNNNNTACQEPAFLGQTHQHFLVSQQQQPQSEYFQYSEQPRPAGSEEYGQCLQQAAVYQALELQTNNQCQSDSLPESAPEPMKQPDGYHMLTSDPGQQYHLLTSKEPFSGSGSASASGSASGSGSACAEEELSYCLRGARSPSCDSDASEESQSQFSSAAESASTADGGSSLTRDERRARCANIPLTYNEIVNLSIDQFNEQLARHKLTESQLTLIKDIRRRGKNKVAAQSCRKRKMEQIYELQQEVGQLVARRRQLVSERAQLAREHAGLVEEYDKVYARVQDKMHEGSVR